MKNAIYLDLSMLDATARQAVSTAVQRFAFSLGYHWTHSPPNQKEMPLLIDKPVLVFTCGEKAKIIYWTNSVNDAEKGAITYTCDQLPNFCVTLMDNRVSTTLTISVSVVFSVFGTQWDENKLRENLANQIETWRRELGFTS